MKKATLLAFTGTVAVILVRIYLLVSNLFAYFDYYDNVIFIASSLVSIIGYSLIAYFFRALYKKQK